MNQVSESVAYLTFLLGDEKFAIPVHHVQEVVELGYVAKVPGTPAYMLGIINLRGKVLPLLDTRRKLGLPGMERTRQNRILIIDLQDADNKQIQIGAIVDVAKEVVEIYNHQILETSEAKHYNQASPVTGIVINSQEDVTLIMDIEKVFSTNEIAQLGEAFNTQSIKNV